MCVRSGSRWGSADLWWWRPWSRSVSTRRASSSPSCGLLPRESLHLMNSRMTSDESTHSWNYPFTEFLSQTCCVRGQFLGVGRGPHLSWLLQNTECSPCDLHVAPHLDRGHPQDDGRLQMCRGWPDCLRAPGLVAQPPQVRRERRLNTTFSLCPHW